MIPALIVFAILAVVMGIVKSTKSKKIENAISDNPSDIGALKKRVQFKLRQENIGINDYEKVELDLNSIMMLSPNDNWAKLYLGIIACRRKHFDVAIELLHPIFEHYSKLTSEDLKKRPRMDDWEKYPLSYAVYTTDIEDAILAYGYSKHITGDVTTGNRAKEIAAFFHQYIGKADYSKLY